MASAIEQLTRNANWGALAKAAELKQRLLFVLGALLVYRLGTYIPVPGIDIQAWEDIFSRKGGGILDMFNMFSGGALGNMAIFALSVLPYISASIIMQFYVALTPEMKAMQKEGPTGRAKITQWTRYLTVGLATVQAYGLAVGMEQMGVVLDPGLFFRAGAVITLVGGTMFLMWLGEQITARGIGNGISLIIMAGIVAQWPVVVAQILEMGRSGELNLLQILFIFALVAGVVVFIVFMERAARRIVVQYPKRQVGRQIVGGQASHMPMKVNMAGVMPPILASACLLMPLSVVNMLGAAEGGDWLAVVARYLQHGTPLFMGLYGALIVFFAFFYVALVGFNADERADDLRRHGGFVPGVKPGRATADYLDILVTRLTAIGAAYITLVCLVPEFLVAGYGPSFYALGGTSMLIVVSVTIDTVAQVHSHLIAHQYEGLIKKAKLGGRGR
ncbi:MAG TPA: preprotein translocase subunit SecY [Rhodospirillaceae bacterium]|jgi:preprotein translocase subunit SecY|nr:preprotein translocase subunit SecY [Alphaproteobacteria bacterium]HBH25911.1 preprotein translocase subunit SecY [Rhodospirillaceae bacterium]